MESKGLKSVKSLKRMFENNPAVRNLPTLQPHTVPNRSTKQNENCDSTVGDNGESHIPDSATSEEPNEEKGNQGQRLPKVKPRTVPVPVPRPRPSKTAESKAMDETEASGGSRIGAVSHQESILNEASITAERHRVSPVNSDAFIQEEVGNPEDRVVLRNNYSVSTIRETVRLTEDVVYPNRKKDSAEVLDLIEGFKVSERMYKKELKDLILVSELYLVAVRRHSSSSIREKSEEITKSVEDLKKFQSKFYADLDLIENMETLLKCFLNNELLFLAYQKFLSKNLYQVNMSLGNPDVAGFEKVLRLKDLLRVRLGDYINLLDEIKKAIEDNHISRPSLEQAYRMVKSCRQADSEVPKKSEALKVNEEVPPWIFTDCTLDDEFGQYLMQNTFKVVSDSFKDRLTVHLYTKVLLFTKEDERGFFFYQKHIKMEELGTPSHKVTEKRKHTLEFPHYTLEKVTSYRFEKQTEKIVKVWHEIIKSILKEQLEREKKRNSNH